VTPLDRDLERLARLIVAEHLGNRLIREAITRALACQARGYVLSRASTVEIALGYLRAHVEAELERVIARELREREAA
jgi:hypothetical protein